MTLYTIVAFTSGPAGVELKDAVLRSGVGLYTKPSVFTEELREGDWLANDMGLGPVTAEPVDMRVLVNGENRLGYRLSFRNGDDILMTRQRVEVFRPVTIVPAEEVEPEPVKAETGSVVLRMTEVETGLLYELFRRFIAGEALYDDGPLKDLAEKIGTAGVDVAQPYRLYNANQGQQVGDEKYDLYRSKHAVLKYV